MIIGISGPSCSGKSSLARALATRLGAPALHLDRHFIEEAERPVVMGHPSFEQPHQYDADMLMEELDEAAGRHQHVVVEGFLLFTYEGLPAMCDRRVHLDVTHQTLMGRRMARLGACDDVKGGRIKDADAAWAAHGEAEWLRFGAIQATMAGVETIRPEKMPEGRGAETLADLLLARWRITA